MRQCEKTRMEILLKIGVKMFAMGGQIHTFCAYQGKKGPRANVHDSTSLSLSVFVTRVL